MDDTGLERKFARFGSDLNVVDGATIEGYASLFGEQDQGGDIVEPGAYGASLSVLEGQNRKVKMLWQHDPAQPIGVWDEVREDQHGLFVRGRLLECIVKGREVAALISAGAVDGLSIGYRTVMASKNDKGQRLLKELELWEVSVVTFPMLTSARVAAKGDRPKELADLREVAAVLERARLELARR